MIYISLLHLNPNSRMVQSELANPYQLHRTLMRGFNTTREQASMLHRVDIDNRGVHILVQSAEKPDWQPLRDVGQGNYLLQIADIVKTVDFTLSINTTYRFRLRANPTIAKKRDGKKNSNRVPLVRENNQIEWLHKKGKQHGFKLLQVSVSQSERNHSAIHRDKTTTHSVTITTVQYDGVLQITDADLFNQAWRTGIGPAKAFGCGLLSLARA